MGDDMEKKVSPFFFTLKRLIDFLKLFIKNKRALFGIFLILLFVFMAIFAPWLTPYNSLGEDPNIEGPLSGKRAAPEWLAYLPSWLGGNPHLSKNLVVFDRSLNYSYLTPDTTIVNVNVQYDNEIGYPLKVKGFPVTSDAGSFAVTYTRSAGTAPGVSTIYLYREFNFPFSGMPSRIKGNLELLVDGTVEEIKLPLENWYIIQIDAPLEKGKPKPYFGDISVSVDDSDGIHVAAANITVKDWLSSADKNWWDWLNSNWENMKWVVTEGSLVNKTYLEVREAASSVMYDDTGDVYPYHCFMDDARIADPNLESNNDSPDIYMPRKWFAAKTELIQDSIAGDSQILVYNTTGFDVGDYITIGNGVLKEPNIVSGVGPNYINLSKSLGMDHPAGEIVVNNKFMIYQNIKVTTARLYIVMKVVVTEPKLYQLKINSPPSTTVVIYSLYHGIFRNPTGTTIKSESRLYSLLGRQYITIDAIGSQVLLVPIKVRVFIGRADKDFSNMTKLFPPEYIPSISSPPAGFYIDYYGEIGNKTGEVYIAFANSGRISGWIISKNSPSDPGSLMSVEDTTILNEIFSAVPGRYVYGLEISILDFFAADKDVSLKINVDDFGVVCFGTSFGLMGTDALGRDLFAQLVYGARISLYIGLLVSILSVAIGLFVGLVAGYLGGVADQLLMRINDIMLVLPGLPLLIILVAVLGARIENLIILLGLLGWNGFARVVRSQVLSLKERAFVEAAKAVGAGRWHILSRHILPHVMSLVYVSLASSVPGAITAEAALSWLGFTDPQRMSWGRMLHEVFLAGATKNWWWVIPPGLCIALIATSFILLGYALDEALNPKLRMRV